MVEQYYWIEACNWELDKSWSSAKTMSFQWLWTKVFQPQSLPVELRLGSIKRWHTHIWWAHTLMFTKDIHFIFSLSAQQCFLFNSISVWFKKTFQLTCWIWDSGVPWADGVCLLLRAKEQIAYSKYNDIDKINSFLYRKKSICITFKINTEIKWARRW